MSLASPPAGFFEARLAVILIQSAVTDFYRYENSKQSSRTESFESLIKMFRYKKIIHVEVSQRPDSTVSRKSLMEYVKKFLADTTIENLPVCLSDDNGDLGDICEDVNRVSITASHPISNPATDDSKVEIHLYKLNPFESGIESAMELSDDVNAALCHTLPCADFDGLWESLIYATNIKEDILKYIETAMITHECKVDTMLLGLNRLVLLYGPPGTGKTSLSKALAQKTSIRMSDKFIEFQLVEINSHSLFSKWFSESGKLVQKMFDQLHDLLENPELFLFVLIDEVESLTMSRKDSKNEPSDGLRVVNALLTQIDLLKNHGNVLVLATSNLKNSIDDAFLDRADVTYFVDLPTHETAYDILYSCIVEFKKKGLVNKEDLILSYKFFQGCGASESEAQMEGSNELISIVKVMKPSSARLLRKVAFQALMKVPQLPASLGEYLDALRQCCSQ